MLERGHTSTDSCRPSWVELCPASSRPGALNPVSGPVVSDRPRILNGSESTQLSGPFSLVVCVTFDNAKFSYFYGMEKFVVSPYSARLMWPPLSNSLNNQGVTTQSGESGTTIKSRPPLSNPLSHMEIGRKIGQSGTVGACLKKIPTAHHF